VDGLLISIIPRNEKWRSYTGSNQPVLPIVFFDRELESINTARIITNDFECGYLATKHLLDKGCKRPVFFSSASCLFVKKGLKVFPLH